MRAWIALSNPLDSPSKRKLNFSGAVGEATAATVVGVAKAAAAGFDATVEAGCDWTVGVATTCGEQELIAAISSRNTIVLIKLFFVDMNFLLVDICT